MKYLLLFLFPLAFSAAANANVADSICKINGTELSFDLGSSTPATEGSRFFAGITVSKGDQTVLTVAPDSPDYTVNYADGVLDDGADYFVLSISSRTNANNSLYFFSREKSAKNPAYTSAVSSIPGLRFPANATFTCED